MTTTPLTVKTNWQVGLIGSSATKRGKKFTIEWAVWTIESFGSAFFHGVGGMLAFVQADSGSLNVSQLELPEARFTTSSYKHEARRSYSRRRRKKEWGRQNLHAVLVHSVKATAAPADRSSAADAETKDQHCQSSRINAREKLGIEVGIEPAITLSEDSLPFIFHCAISPPFALLPSLMLTYQRSLTRDAQISFWKQLSWQLMR